MANQAQFPKSNYSRPKAMSIDSLALNVIGEAGETLAELDFSNLNVPRLIVSELVTALERGTSSSGRWRTKASVEGAASMLRSFSKAIAIANPELKTMADFSPEMWWVWRSAVHRRTRWPGQVNLARCLLYEVDNLMPTTRRALAAREKKPKTRLYESYSVAEYRRIYAAAWAMVRAARQRIRSNLAILESYRNGQEPDDAPSLPIKGVQWTQGQLLDYIHRHGVLPGKIPGSSVPSFRKLLNTPSHGYMTQEVFASSVEVLAGIILLVCERGFNLSVLSGLTSQPHNADIKLDNVTVHALDKPRRGPEARYFSSTFTGKAGRIWRVLQEITQPARDCLAFLGQPTDTLLIGRASGSVPSKIFKFDWEQHPGLTVVWQRLSGLKTDSGEPLVIDFRRIRLTDQVANKRANQNSDRVSESVYRQPDAQTHEVARGVILQGQLDAVSDARAVMTVRAITAEEQANARIDPEALAAGLNVSTSRVKQLLDGKFDTVVTACKDIKQSPFAEPGHVCPASFLSCFGCKNAIATPNHLPRIVLLHDAISEMSSVVSNAVWFADYKAVFDQLSLLLESYSTLPERIEARGKATANDKKMIRQLLDRRYDS